MSQRTDWLPGTRSGQLMMAKDWTAYFAVQIENEGKKGPLGPVVSALIP